MNTPRLSEGMMARYEIENRRPARVNLVQFGLGEALLGAVDRLIDDAAPAWGIACVAGGPGAAQLRGQDGLYTLIVRGYEGEEPVNREQVVQRILRVVDPSEMAALAADPGLELMLVDDAPQARSDAERFCELRAAAGLPGLPRLRLGENLLADSLALRAEADEAAKLCRDMNYLDGMLHLAEPFCRATHCAPCDVPGLIRVSEEAFCRETALTRQVFEAGLVLCCAPGWLNGCDTLSDVMKQPRLRRFVGEAFTRELLPLLQDLPAEAVRARVIESFARYENPLNRNRLLRTARRPLQWFIDWGVPLMRRHAEAHFEPPRRLAFALAATVMLLAGARQDPDSDRYLVARGKLAEPVDEDPARLSLFATLSHDMPPEALAYAVLADRELWQGADLRQIDGLEARLTLDLSAMQRDPAYLPEGAD